MAGTPESLEQQVLAEHREVVVDVCETGKAVATAWSEETVTDPKRVTRPLAALLAEQGLDTALLGLLKTAVRTVGASTAGTPVPAAPYFVVTSRGPLCRATLDDGRRLVVRLNLFTVERHPRAYRFRHPSPETCLEAGIYED